MSVDAELHSPEDLFRRRLLTVYSFAFVAQITGTTLQRVTSETIRQTDGIGFILVCIACLLGALSAYFRWHMRAVGRTMMLLGGTSVVLILVYQGGLTSYNAASLFVLPAICALMLGSRDTAFFAGFVLVSLTALYLFDSALPPFELPQEDVLGATFRSLLIVSILIIISLVFLVRETEMTDARLREVLERQRFAAEHDPLTGLANRAAMNAFMTKLKESREPHIFYLIDLDNFKPVNDVCGHAVGDSVLVQMAQLMLLSAPPNTMVARLGGDEFFVGVPVKPADSSTAPELGARLAKVLLVSPANNQNVKAVTASVGSARFTGTTGDPAVVLSKADKALYAAKAAGKGTYISYQEPPMKQSA